MNLLASGGSADDEGWIQWDGGERPFAKGIRFEVRLRSGEECIGNVLPAWDWKHYGHDGDIVAYRVRVERQTVWVAFTNTDCSEGRGRDIPIAVCVVEATARRVARRQYVQGSDGPVRSMELVQIDGKWYMPSAAIVILEPTREDIAEQAAVDAKRAALAKAKAAGLTDDDLLALSSGV